MTEQDRAAPVWPAEVGWRVRSGASLLSAAPLSAELAEAHRREDERERLRLSVTPS